MLPSSILEIEVQTIRTFQLKLDANKTNGHNFCEFSVNPKDFSFYVRLGHGKSYSYQWNSPGQDFIRFLINAFQNESYYLYGKLHDEKLTKFIDIEITANKLNEKFQKARQEDILSEEEYQDIIEKLDEFKDYCNDEMTMPCLLSVYPATFLSAINHGIIEKEPYDENSVTYATDFDCEVFTTKIAPLLAEVLIAYYQ